MVPMLTSAMGEHLRHFVVRGEPQGFSVARKANARTMAIKHWKDRVTTTMGHKYSKVAVIATIERPVFIHVEPYFSSRIHCDPENVRKLLVDAIYLEAGPGSGQDKYVFGSHAGPQYDMMNPRTEVWLWRTHGQEPPVISKSARAAAMKARATKERESDRLETVRGKARREKIRASNPFGIKT